MLILSACVFRLKNAFVVASGVTFKSIGAIGPGMDVARGGTYIGALCAMPEVRGIDRNRLTTWPLVCRFLA